MPFSDFKIMCLRLTVHQATRTLFGQVLLGRNPNESLEVQQMMPIRLSLTNRLKEVKSEYDLTVKHEL